MMGKLWIAAAIVAFGLLAIATNDPRRNPPHDPADFYCWANDPDPACKQ